MVFLNTELGTAEATVILWNTEIDVVRFTARSRNKAVQSGRRCRSLCSSAAVNRFRLKLGTAILPSY